MTVVYERDFQDHGQEKVFLKGGGSLSLDPTHSRLSVIICQTKTYM